MMVNGDCRVEEDKCRSQPKRRDLLPSPHAKERNGKTRNQFSDRTSAFSAERLPLHPPQECSSFLLLRAPLSNVNEGLPLSARHITSSSCFASCLLRHGIAVQLEETHMSTCPGKIAQAFSEAMKRRSNERQPDTRHRLMESQHFSISLDRS